MTRLFFYRFLLALILLPLLLADVRADILFSQQVSAIDAQGRAIAPVNIDVQAMPAMQAHDFELGRGRLLQVRTNIDQAETRGLKQVAATIQRCYDHVETVTGLQLKRGVLLYLIERDVIPLAYRFDARYAEVSQWGQVRLVMLERGAALHGENASIDIKDMLFDTLPHELGHDLLNQIPQLAQDVDGASSVHTRWFTEGVCELLAKTFSAKEDAAYHQRALALRQLPGDIGPRSSADELL
ncbi:MAG: hypothetical protein OET90_09410, partial [Desulfuromonadales bacterium]|nr:hypothetical protein [Desulfuromonadales bacterium]